MKSEELRNLILAIVLSALVLIGWNFYFGPKLQPKPQAGQDAATTMSQTAAPGAQSPAGSAALAAEPKTRDAVLNASARVSVDTTSLGGSIDLTGGLIDDIILKGYRETIDPKSPNITLLSPPGGPSPYWAQTGFVSETPGVKTPNLTTPWSADASTLKADHPVTLTWDNGAGLKFTRVVAVDDRYMFTITDWSRIRAPSLCRCGPMPWCCVMESPMFPATRFCMKASSA